MGSSNRRVADRIRRMPRLPLRSIALYLALMLSACGGGQTVSIVSNGSTGSAGSTPSPGSAGMPTSNATDYSVAAHWVCRPESDTVCTTGLDALVQFADGSTQAQPFTPAANPPIDCFYVYPTVSEQQMQFADLTNTPITQPATSHHLATLS